MDIIWKDFLLIITLIHDIRTKKNDNYVLIYLTTLCSGYSTEVNISNALKVVCGIPFYSCEVPHSSLPMKKQQLPVKNSWTSLRADSDSDGSGHSVTPIFRPSAKA